MSEIFNNPISRIKPKLLREQKTEALLVFIRTLLEQYFQDLDKNKIYLKMETNEDNNTVVETLKVLLAQLQATVVNSIYLRDTLDDAYKSRDLMLLAKKEEAMMFYYGVLIKQTEVSLVQGQNWIPEQFIICLLSEWILEEEKSALLYPFLEMIDYTSILSIYDNVVLQAKKDNDLNKIISIKHMYEMSHDLIMKLKYSTYKINTQRISKTRKKK
mgnify:CR=1 FL=1